MENLIWLLSADVIAILTLAVGVGRFISNQTKRIVITESQINVLLAEVAKLQAEQATRMANRSGLMERIAVLETQVTAVLESQRRLENLLLERRLTITESSG